MKTLLLASIAVFAVMDIANAQNGLNSSPHALACMKKAGITYAGWRSGHAGTQAQVDKYIACRDSKKK